MNTASERKTIGLMELLIIAGFATFFGWFMFWILGAPMAFPNEGSDVVRHGVQLAGLLGFTIGIVLVMVTAASFVEHATHRPIIIGWTVICVILPALLIAESFGVSVPTVASGIVSFIMGLAAGYFYSVWENLAVVSRVRNTQVMVGVSMVIGCALFLIVYSVMTPLAEGVMCILFIVISGALLYFANVRRAPEKPDQAEQPEQVTGTKAKKQLELLHSNFFNKKLSVLFLIENLPLGFALPLLCTTSPAYFYAVVGVAVLLMLLYTVFAKYTTDLVFTQLLRISIGVSFIALIPLALSGSYASVTAFILVALWLLVRLAHNGTLLKLTGIQTINPVYLVSRGKLPGTIGFVVGFAFSFAVVAAGGGEQAISHAAMLLLAVLMLGTLILLPVSTHYSKQLAKEVEQALPVDADDRTRCQRLAKRFGLSPREEEVLYYIVKGRNAKYISEKLVISESTAKTHIHNIYKKSGVHSQQKFIDLLDELNQ